MDAEALLKKTVERLRQHGGSYAEICRQNPVLTYSWLTKLAHGQIKNPTVSSLQQLIEALDAYEKASTPNPPPVEQVVPPADPDAQRIQPVETA